MLITKTYVNSDQHLFFFSSTTTYKNLNILTRAKEKRERKKASQ